MYKNVFGTKNQIRFDTKADYYEFLGYLAKEDGTTKLVWENNDEQGAWAQEGRIQFYVAQPVALRARLKHTSGNTSIISRVNCNDFVEHIAQYHHFISNGLQNKTRIRASIPPAHLKDFKRGLAL
jgi:hypothetical protein